jgi:chromosome segregation ATPase
MADILSKMKKPGTEFASEAFVRLSDARQAVQGEINEALATAATARNRADVAEAERRSAESKLQMVQNQVSGLESQIVEFKSKVDQLNRMIKLEQQTAQTVKADGERRLSEAQDRLKEDLSREREKWQGLKEELAEMKGQLRATKKASPPVILPEPRERREIPEFIIEDFKRGGPRDQIVSVKVKPVRAN